MKKLKLMIRKKIISWKYKNNKYITWNEYYLIYLKKIEDKNK